VKSKPSPLRQKFLTVPLEQLPQRLLPDQVAGVLNCSDDHVRNLVEEGLLVAVNISPSGNQRQHLRIEKESLTNFLAKRRTAPFQEKGSNGGGKR
jgi:hypothetical protein